MKLKLIMLSLILFMFAGCNTAVVDVSNSSSNISLNLSNLNVNTNNSVVQVNQFGVPITFNKQMASEEKYFIQKGTTTDMQWKPQIPTEHVKSDRKVKAIVNDSQWVGQIIKLSSDNINTATLTFEIVGNETFDDFESYASSADLQSVWVGSNIQPELETSIVYEGSKSMEMDAYYADEDYTRTITASDMTGINGNFRGYFTTNYNNMKWEFYIGDGTNTKSTKLTYNEVNTWIDFNINIDEMTEDQAGTTDVTQITKVGFRCTDASGGWWSSDYMYVDLIEKTSNSGLIDIELWDMGNLIPINQTTKLTDGTKYLQLGDLTRSEYADHITLDLTYGKKTYHLDKFLAGVSPEIYYNELLTENNYYAIVLKKRNVDVAVYGSSNYKDYYKNGFAFTTPDNSTNITQISKNADLQFVVFTLDDVYLTNARAIANNEPGDNAEYMSGIDNINLTITDVIIPHGQYVPKTGDIDFINRPIFMPKGSKFNLKYYDDYTDSVTNVILGAQYFYQSRVLNG